LKKVEYELFIAKVYLKCGSYHESLFQTLKIIDRTEEYQMTLLNQETMVHLAEIHLEMGAYYEALVVLNDIKATEKLKIKVCTLRARVVVFLSHEVHYNEVGAVAMKKAVIKELDEMVILIVTL